MVVIFQDTVLFCTERSTFSDLQRRISHTTCKGLNIEWPTRSLLCVVSHIINSMYYFGDLSGLLRLSIVNGFDTHIILSELSFHYVCIGPAVYSKHTGSHKYCRCDFGC